MTIRPLAVRDRRQATACLTIVALGLLAAPSVWARGRMPSARPDRDLYFRAKAAQEQLEASPRLNGKRSEWERVALQYRGLVARYPQSVYCDDALLRAGDLYSAMAARLRRSHDLDEAVRSYNLLVAEYPSSSLAEQALFSAFEIQQKRRGAPRNALDEAARRYLKNFPDGAHAAAVRRAIHKVATPATPPLPPPPPPGLARVFNLRAWTGDASTRVVIDLERCVNFQQGRLENPDRLFIDLLGTRLHPNLDTRTFPVSDGLLEQVRVAQFNSEVVRVVLDFKDIADERIFCLDDQNPVLLVIDVRAPGAAAPPPFGKAGAASARERGAPSPPTPTPAPPRSAGDVERRAAARPTPTATPKAPSREARGTPRTVPTPTPRPVDDDPDDDDASTVHRSAARSPTPAPRTERPPSEQSRDRSRRPPATVTATEPDIEPARVAEAPAERSPAAAASPGPQPNRSGNYSLVRQLGLGARRIVIDPGHGGHDPGTIGRSGLQEKDLVLDVALRLERLVRDQLGLDVVMTRRTDVFIPLVERTAIANAKEADLFLSIHVNSSRASRASGVETYYLNFAADAHAEEVAARENAISPATLKDLSGLVKAIMQNSKIEESRDFAANVQGAMVTTLRPLNNVMEDRGVRRAPFYVLLGANMPSILAEIAFVSHRDEEKLLRSARYRDAIAEGLLRGIRRYLDALHAGRSPAIGFVEPPAQEPRRQARR